MLLMVEISASAIRLLYWKVRCVTRRRWGCSFWVIAKFTLKKLDQTFQIGEDLLLARGDVPDCDNPGLLVICLHLLQTEQK